MKNLSFITGIAFIAFWTGATFCAADDDMPIRTVPEKYGYGLVVSMLTLTAIPFLLGYQAGKSSN